jgi:hypothetical protein
MKRYVLVHGAWGEASEFEGVADSGHFPLSSMPERLCATIKKIAWPDWLDVFISPVIFPVCEE